MPGISSRAEDRVSDRTRGSASRGLTSVTAQRMPAAQVQQPQAHMVACGFQDQLQEGTPSAQNQYFGVEQHLQQRPLPFGAHASANAHFQQPGHSDGRLIASPQHVPGSQASPIGSVFMHPNQHINNPLFSSQLRGNASFPGTPSHGGVKIQSLCFLRKRFDDASCASPPTRRQSTRTTATTTGKGTLGNSEELTREEPGE